MKKVILALVCVLALGATLTSCDKDKEKCWKTQSTIGGLSSTGYIWASQNKMDAWKSGLESKGYVDVKYSRASKFKTALDCADANLHQ